MYVLPKSLESLWIAARGKGLVFRTGKWGEPLVSVSGTLKRSEYNDISQQLATIGMGMVMVSLFVSFDVVTGTKFRFQSTYQNDPQHLSGLVRRILYQFIGPN